ncbi:hypothetical protein EYF80_016167 [Liparis tanakae]|uniref:Uncharacterized protein n=1 Tax=Liparis tanakae TaxID=230148 RepID=A0A4Z2I889_9TELE|nr:hypothetical protein EYF80_016167 [Liparis tanakae]
MQLRTSSVTQGRNSGSGVQPRHRFSQLNDTMHHRLSLKRPGGLREGERARRDVKAFASPRSRKFNCSLQNILDTTAPQKLGVNVTALYFSIDVVPVFGSAEQPGRLGQALPALPVPVLISAARFAEQRTAGELRGGGGVAPVVLESGRGQLTSH